MWNWQRLYNRAYTRYLAMVNLVANFQADEEQLARAERLAKYCGDRMLRAGQPCA